MFGTRPVTQGLLHIFRLRIFLASIILHKILLWGGFVVQDKLKLFFFSCWAWAHPDVQLLEGGGLCRVESWFGWKFALRAICISLLSQGSWWAFRVLPPSPAVEFCFPVLPPSSVGFPPVPSANSLMAFLPADKASIPGERRRCVRGGFTSLHHQLIICSHDSRGVLCECLVRLLRKILPKCEANPLSVIHETFPFSG